MDGHDLLHQMRGITEFEAVGDTLHTERKRPQTDTPNLSDCITHVVAGNRRMPVLKAMTTTACERDCHYCPFRAGRSAMRRATFVPDDLARGFMALYRGGAVEGLFLSSGVVRGGVTSQDSILDVGAILREKYNFLGYMHLKLMPGAERDQVIQAMKLADRVSANLEAPNAPRLAEIAPQKQFDAELLTRLKWVEDIRQQSEGQIRASSTTEFVVGPAGERDVELLSATDYLHNQLKLARVYFSAFRPVRDTPLDNVAPTTEQRKVRLYQASFLLRDYGFSVEELPFRGEGDLPQHTDPKTAWAEDNLRHAPIELNLAERKDLLRVPGIGMKNAARILAARRQGTLRNLTDVRALGINGTRRMVPYILINGRSPDQPKLF